MSKYVVQRTGLDGEQTYVSTQRAVYEAIVEKKGRDNYPWGSELRGIEDRIEAAAGVTARFLDLLLEKNIISDLDVETVLGYDNRLRGRIVENPNPED